MTRAAEAAVPRIQNSNGADAGRRHDLPDGRAGA